MPKSGTTPIMKIVNASDNSDTYQAVVVKAYKNQYPDPICVVVGDVVALGKHDETWQGWIWAENTTHSGWIPEQMIASDDGKSGKILADYTAKELTVNVGETVTVLQTLNRWCWVKHSVSNDEGWLPEENLTSLSTS